MLNDIGGILLRNLLIEENAEDLPYRIGARDDGRNLNECPENPRLDAAIAGHMQINAPCDCERNDHKEQQCNPRNSRCDREANAVGSVQGSDAARQSGLANWREDQQHHGENTCSIEG